MARSSIRSQKLNRLAVLGAGKMGGILIEAFVKGSLVAPKDILATVHHAAMERKTLAGSAVTPGTDNRAAVRAADVILVCVKPQTVGQLLDEFVRNSTRRSSLSQLPPPSPPITWSAASVPACR